MTVVVTRMAGGVSQVFTPETGRIAYRAKTGATSMYVEACGGVVRFGGRGSTAVVSGGRVSLEGCTVVREGEEGYAEALAEAARHMRRFAGDVSAAAERRASELERRLGPARPAAGGPGGPPRPAR